MPRLIITAPDGKRGILEITRSILTIGRGSANDLVLPDNSVSRYHAVVKQTKGGFSVGDRGSTNGVMMAGQRLAEEHPLRDGDVFHVGAYALKYESVEDAALVVRQAEVPSTLKNVLKGRAQTATRIEPEADTPKILQQFWKLAHENYLLRLLYDAGKTLQSRLSVDDIGSAMLELAFRIENVERGFVMMMDETGKVLRQTEVKYRRAPGAEQPQIILSRAILQRMKANPEPILISDFGCDERFSASDSMKSSGLRSAMCAPLAGANTGRLFGILYVDNMEKAAAFTQEEMNVFAVIASQAAAAVENATAHRQLAEEDARRRALERFLAPEVVEMVAADPQGIRLGGANQKVTILFADIRGFTAMAENLPPETIVEVLNAFFTRVTDVIFEFGGTLDKYMGDAVMALFGAPLSKRDDAVRAVRAAVAIEQLMAELNRDARERGWPKLGVGIGVNTGIVTAGNIGSPRRLDYTVIGDPVNVAFRLMSHALPAQVLVSADTAAELGSAFTLAALKPLLVKGKSEPLRVFSVEWKKKKKAMKARRAKA
ncbi:MAG TPA: adenylate/guanylate cyclase domain-containing protein [Terriglobales bacterium]|nr:adenylate/guanylate cyclase domain-containing protein [Terriglobales bacterium]